jgi:hypothetical protein
MRGRTFHSGTKLAVASVLLGYATIAGAAEPTVQPTDGSATEAQDPVQAQPPASQPDTIAEQPSSSKKWEFSTTGYGWFANAKGETDVIGPVPPVGLDLSFGTILKHLKFVLMGAAEARHDRLIFAGDLMWVHLGASKGLEIRDQDFLNGHLDNRMLTVTALGGYRVAAKGPVIVDILAGGRLNGVKVAMDLTGPNRSASGSVSQTWLDPVIAVRANAPLGGKTSLTLYGDAGGVLWGSDFTWQGLATVNYQINAKMRIGAGWRYFKVNYDKGDFLYDVAQSGPIITFRTVF